MNQKDNEFLDNPNCSRTDFNTFFNFCQKQISKTQFKRLDLTQAEKNKIISTIESFCEKMEQIELNLNSKNKSSGFYD